MSIQEVSAEELAALFHHYHQALAPDFGCRDAAKPEPWEQLAPEEQRRAVAAARLTLMEIATTSTKPESSRSYFAKPGEAEWGC